MKPKTLISLALSGRLSLVLSLTRLAVPVYRACFVSAAISRGLLVMLSKGALPFDRLAGELSPEPFTRDGLLAWLQFGVRLGELRLGPEGYSLRGRLSKQLAHPDNDSAAALLQELVELHHKFIVEAPERLRRGRKFSLADQNGELTARSSRILEPFVEEAIDNVVPRSGPFRVLEVGCGSGIYIRYAAKRNRDLTAVGLELQPAVAEFARKKLGDWNLADRITVETIDVRERTPDAAFDLVTLHNNIYYFPVESRLRVLEHLRGFLKPNGCLLLTTGCRGGSLSIEFLNLWAAMTEGCGPLPVPSEMVEQLKAAGFRLVKAKNLIPGAPTIASLRGRGHRSEQPGRPVAGPNP